MAVPAELFIMKAEEIAAEDPRYQKGQDGSHGQCDCIGLLIGAIRRAGGQWRGMHGSNYAARAELVKLMPIAGSSELIIGEAVFKAYEPGQGGYALPERYEPGGSYYNGDLRDYYHVGIVESVHPLRIRHMTSPRAKMDTTLGKWAYHGKLKKVDYAGGAAAGGEQSMGTVIIRGGNLDAPIRMRSGPSKTAPVIADIPQDSTAELIENCGQWAHVKWDGKSGYVMSEFVSVGSGDKVTVSRTELERVYDMLGDMLGLRG